MMPLYQITGKKAKNLSQMDFLGEKGVGIKGRRFAVFIADGFDKAQVEEFKKTITDQSALAFVIGERRGIMKQTGQKDTEGGIKADHHWEGQRSTMFDGLYIPGGTHVDTLCKSGRALHWVREAFGHLKVIAASGEAVKFVKKALADAEGLKYSDSSVECSYGVITAGANKHTELVTEFVSLASQHKIFKRELDGLSTMVAY